MSGEMTCACGGRLDGRDDDFGLAMTCPECGREYAEGKSSPKSDVLIIGEGPAVLSLKAVVSFLLGLCFFLACVSGIPAILIGSRATREIDGSGGRLRGRGLARAGVVLGVLGCLFTLVVVLMPATRSARSAARRSQCVNNLKQIGLALYNYRDVYGCFPPSAMTDKDGKPLLSWRVAILPFIEGSPLYSDFHLDEPWDSPHNLALVDRMPSFYGCPSDTNRKPGTTNYQVVIGPDTAFTPDFKPLSVTDFTDGLAVTLIVGESTRTVPWTKPVDLPHDPTAPLLGLGSLHSKHHGGFNVLFGDWSVRFIKETISPETLKAILNRNGAEMVPPGGNW